MLLHRLVVCALSIAVLHSIAFANGRPPSTSTINFQRGDDTKIVAGLTFGAVVSSDNGATWNWMCEQAIGYGGNYDPDYINTPTVVFATTFDGLKVNRDSCSYEASSLSPTPPAIKFVSTITAGPNGEIYAAAADPMDGRIYKSTDNGATFPTSTMPGQLNDWWQSIEVAPSDANIVYLSGYRLAGQQKTFLFFRSSNGGQSFQPLPVTDFAVMSSSNIEIVGVSRTNPDLLFAKVIVADNVMSDAVYRSTNGGQSWTKILELPTSISVLLRANGGLVAGTISMGAQQSIDNGDTWTPLTAPHINCLAENVAGEVWACTQNYGGATIPSDGYGIMKSTDLVSWTGVLRYQDIAAPVPCSPGTLQKDTCDTELWCGFCSQIGCNANRECATSDAPPDARTTTSNGGGCCDAGERGPGSLLLLATVLVLVRRKRARTATVLGLVLCSAFGVRDADANGRAPATNGVFFQPSENSSIYIRTTFGVLISHDDGCSFRWVCEQNVGYGGMFDPKYAIATDGTLFATTFTGLRVSRDGGCSFTTATSELAPTDPNRLADRWVDALDISPTGEVWVATADSGKPNDIYRSTDNGVTFSPRGMLSPTIWWKSLRVAPTDPLRVYVAGYEVATKGDAPPIAHLFTTVDGGANWDPSPLTNVQFGPTPIVNVVAVDPNDASIIYLISLGANAIKGDRLYRSIDGGISFSEVLVTATTIRDVVIVDATTVLVAVGMEGTFRSINGGSSFELLQGAPQLECLGRRSDGTLVGCGANWEPDFKAVARTADLTQWTKAFRFVELAGPLECPIGTTGHDVCGDIFAGLQEQFASTGPTDPACSVPPPPADGPIENNKGGCCETSSAPSGAWAILVCLTALILVRRRN